MQMDGAAVLRGRGLSAFERARLKRLIDERVRARHSREDAAIAALKHAARKLKVD